VRASRDYVSISVKINKKYVTNGVDFLDARIIQVELTLTQEPSHGVGEPKIRTEKNVNSEE
jgi:hypothetical protein